MVGGRWSIAHSAGKDARGACHRHPLKRGQSNVARACGADDVILYRDVNFRDAARAYTQARGVDIVFDSVGKRHPARFTLFTEAARALCALRSVVRGNRKFDTLELADTGSVFLTRAHMQHYVATPEAYARRANDVFPLGHRGSTQGDDPHIYPLAASCRRSPRNRWASHSRQLLLTPVSGTDH